MNTGPREWDAETYDAVSDPQFSGGWRCSSGSSCAATRSRSTPAAARAASPPSCSSACPDGRVIAVDGSAAMIAKARERLGDGATYLVADLAELELDEPVDLVFSTATFHWIADHDALFARLRAALKPGGRLVAQCGGEGNVAEHAQAIAAVAAAARVRAALEAMAGVWNFAAPEETEPRLPPPASTRPAAGCSRSRSRPRSRSSSSPPSPSARTSTSSPRSCADRSPKPSSRIAEHR